MTCLGVARSGDPVDEGLLRVEPDWLRGRSRATPAPPHSVAAKLVPGLTAEAEPEDTRARVESVVAAVVIPESTRRRGT
jgi:hypothetical protein